jgi:tetratricopeptide (TPR) repeat protein
MNIDRPHDALIDLLAPRMNDVRARQTFLVSALGLGDPLLNSLDYNQPTRNFILHLCSQIKPDTSRLDRVLDELKRQLGRDDEIDALRPHLHRWLNAGAPDDAAPRIRVFLSYARADDAGADRAAYDDPARSFMRRLYDALKDEFALWWDMEAMPSRGETFTVEIERAIDGCDRLVLVVAPAALSSDYVRAEWRHALARCIPVTPILRAGDYDTVPTELKRLHTPDLRDPRPFADAVDELRRVLREPSGRLAPLHNFERALPEGHIQRETPFQAARDALLTDAISATVVSARPQSAAAIYGLGGLGKSTLAMALAHDCEVRRRYPDGILWVSVTQTPDIQTRLADIGVYFGDPRELYTDPKTDLESAASQLSRTLHDKRALLILDDVWQHEVVNWFRVTDTPCRLLITTRSAALADRSGAANVPLNALSDAEGAALIAARAGGSPDDPTYLQISRALAGHTLAVTLAAARLKRRGADYAQTLLEGLTDPTDPFAHLNVDEQDKDLNLSKSLALSYDALDADGRRRFRALGVFAASTTFDLAALAAVWGEGQASADRAAEALVDASLLDWERESGRYSQHPVLRTYARALLNAAGETLTIFRRYADWVIGEAAAFTQLPLEQWSQLDPLIPHMTEVGDALVDRLVTLLAEAGIGTLESLTAPEVSPEQVRALRDLAEAHGDFFNALDSLTEALGAYLGSRWTLDQQGMHWLRAGLIVQRASLFPDLNSTLFLNRLGMGYAALGETERAEAYLHTSLTISERETDDLNYAAAAHTHLMHFYALLNDVERALHHAEIAHNLYTRIDDEQAHDIINLIDSNVAMLLHNSGQYERVEALLPHLQASLARSSNPVRTLDAMQIEAGFLAWRGEYAHALAIIAQAEEWTATHNLGNEALYHLHLTKAECLFITEQFDASIAVFETLIERLEASNALPRLAEALLAYSRVRNQIGQFDQADALAQRALEAARAVGNARVEFEVLTQLAAHAVDSKKYAKAQHLLDEAETLLNRLPRRGLHFLNYINIRCGTLRLLGRARETIPLLEEALVALPKGQTGHIVDVLEETLALAYVVEKRFDDAEKTLDAAETRAVERDHRLNNLKLVRANMEYLRDRHDAAEALLHDLLHADPPASAPIRSEALLALASIRIDQGRDDDAFALLDESGRLRAELGLRDTSASQREIILAQRAFQRKDYARAERLITTALPAIEVDEPPPEVRAAYRMRLAVLLAQRRWTDAVKEIQRILAWTEAHQLTGTQFEKENRQLIGTLILCLAFEQGIGRVLLRVASRLGWALLRLPFSLLRRLIRRIAHCRTR